MYKYVAIQICFLLICVLSLYGQKQFIYKGQIPNYKGYVHFEFVGLRKSYYRDSVATTDGRFVYKLKDTILRLEPHWINIYYSDSAGKLAKMKFFRSVNSEGKLFALGQILFCREDLKIEQHPKYTKLFTVTQTTDIKLENELIDSELVTRQGQNGFDSLKRLDEVKELVKRVQINSESWYLLQRVYNERASFLPDELDLIVASFSKQLLSDYPTHYNKLIQYIAARRSVDSHGIFKNLELSDSIGKLQPIINGGSKLTLVVFWASWCLPCREEIPVLKQKWTLHKESGFTITSISIDEDKSAWKKALEKEQMPWKNLVIKNNVVKDSYGITSIPLSFLVDSKGAVYEVDVRDDELFEKLILQLR